MNSWISSWFRWRTGYVLFAVTWLTAAVILPVIILELRLFEEEAAGVLQREQQFLGRQINDRRLFIHGYYKEHMAPHRVYPIYSTRIQRGIYYGYSDLTTLLPFSKNPPALKGHTTDYLLKKLRYCFEWLMDEQDMSPPEYLAESEYRIDKGVVSTYFNLIDFSETGSQTIRRAKLKTPAPWMHPFAPVKAGRADGIACLFWAAVLLVILGAGVLLRDLAGVLFFPLHHACAGETVSDLLERLKSSKSNAIVIFSHSPEKNIKPLKNWRLIKLVENPNATAKGLKAPFLITGFGAHVNTADMLKSQVQLLSELTRQAPVVLWLGQEPVQFAQGLLERMSSKEEREKAEPIVSIFNDLTMEMTCNYPAASAKQEKFSKSRSCFDPVMDAETGFNEGISEFREFLSTPRVKQCPDPGRCLEKHDPWLPRCIAGEELIIRIQEYSAPYYARIWRSLSIHEQLVLIDLAQDGLVNLKNALPLTRLLNKGILQQKERIEFVSPSFRNYILTTADTSKLTAEQAKNAAEGTWSKFSVPLKLAAFSILVFLFVTQQNFLSDMNSMLISATAILAVYLRVSGIFTSLKTGSKG